MTDPWCWYANMTGVYGWDPWHTIYSSTMDPMGNGDYFGDLYGILFGDIMDNTLWPIKKYSYVFPAMLKTHFKAHLKTAMSHRIHGAGIYANMTGVYGWGTMLPYIAAPWIRHGMDHAWINYG